MAFITPVSMLVGTKEQSDKLIAQLYDLGYTFSSNTSNWIVSKRDYLATNFNVEPSRFGYTYECNKNSTGRYYIDHYNPELFLALAAMTDLKEGIWGEWYTSPNDRYICKREDIPWNEKGCLNTSYTKMTKEAIIAHFTKSKEQTMKEMYQPGDWAKCITLTLTHFTKGKKYLVEDVKWTISETSLVIRLTDDAGSSYFITTDYFLLSNPVEEKKILGWEMTKPEYVESALRIVDTAIGKKKFLELMALEDNSSSRWISDLSKAGVLDLWFEPVYEPEKPKEIVLTVGSKNDKVIIKKDSITVEGYGQFGKIGVQNLISTCSISPPLTIGVGKYSVTLDEDQHVIRIGCQSGDHWFSIKELKEVMAAYNKLNS